MRAIIRPQLISMLLLFALAPRAHGINICPANCRATGHQTVANAAFPYSEDATFANSTPYKEVTVSGPSFTWVPVLTGCVDLGNNNLFASGQFHTRLLVYLQIGAVSMNLPLGAEYEVQLRVDGVQYGWFVRAYRGRLPQGDHFGTVALSLPAGAHKYEIFARLLDSGSITFTQQFSTSMGSPSSFPYASNVTSSQFTIDGTWRQISGEVTFNSASAVDLYTLGYFQWDTGTTGDEVSVKFMIDGLEPPHTSEVAVPPYFRDGVNIYDHFVNLQPPGTHRISMWARTLNGRPAVISNRAMQFASYPSSTARSGALLVETTAGGTVTIDSTVARTEYPSIFTTQGEANVCGSWVKLLELDIPPTSGDWNWTGEGYVQLIGNQTGIWTNPHAEVMVDVQAQLPAANYPSTDMHWVAFSPLNQRGELYFFVDAMLWGNGGGQKVKLWMRKVTCTGSTGTFQVAKRYLSIKLVPTDGITCYYN
jgi:hypothetical protein